MSVQGAAQAEEVINALRQGVPPQRFVSTYSSGLDQFLTRVRKRIMESASTGGRIRFLSGSYGSGKTHTMRLLAEQAYDAGYLVSTVELNKEEAPFSKFERVFFQIVREITSPAMYAEGDLRHAAPFGEVLRRALFAEAKAEEPAAETYARARARLLQESSVDVDFRRVVDAFWKTYTAELGDPVAGEEERGRILQWFSGEGTVAQWRREYGVQKVVDRANARLMLQSLSRFAVHIGHRGILVLLDEAEMSFTTMRKAELKQAHHNLLHLINSVEESDGLVLVYAATPEFYSDPRCGIHTHGALASRILPVHERAPRALDVVWNIDEVESGDADYLETARRLRELYARAYDDAADELPGDVELHQWILRVVREHPEYSPVSLWRALVTAWVRHLDDLVEGGDGLAPETAHRSVLDDFVA